MPSDRLELTKPQLELTKPQLEAIKKRIRSKYLKADEAALLEGLLEMATLHPDKPKAVTAWHYMIPK
jgi:hypothetical protein